MPSSRTALSMLVLAALGHLATATALAQAPEAGLPPQAALRVRTSSMARDIENAGGRLIADYGSFQVIECDAALAAEYVGLADVEPLEHENQILLHAGVIDTSAVGPVNVLQAPDDTPGKAMRLIQFSGPVLPEWVDALTATGAEVITYIPNNAYLVYGDGPARASLRALAATSGFVRWEGPYLAAYKNLKMTAGLPQGGPIQAPPSAAYSVQLIQDPAANAATLQWIETRRTGAIKSSYQILHYQNLVVPLPADSLGELAERPDVVFVRPFDEPVMTDEAQNLIVAGFVTDGRPSGPSYLEWLESVGFTQEQFDASGFIVDIADSGIDNGTTSPNHFGLYVHGIRPGTSRVVYSRFEGPIIEGSLPDCEGHGTINAHIIAGYNDGAGYPSQDASGFHYALGIVPFAHLGASIIFDPVFTNPSFPDLTSRAYQDGARISSNSWGALFDRSYSETSQVYDALVRDAQPAGSTMAQPGNQELVTVFSAGNAGPFGQSIGSPATAKNVISVGASENFRLFGGTDSCFVSDAQADSANDIANLSSRGTTEDGRQKPDLVAPGTHITGGAIQLEVYSALGAANPCFNGVGTCGGVAPDLFFPPGQQLYTASSGTSHSCPAVSAGAALIRQMFINQGWTPPSPAMTKALLMNSARYMTGVGANDTLPSPNQGMGAMNLQEVLTRGTTVPTMLRDQLIEDLVTATGEMRSFTGSVADAGRPVRITLVWTDAPGSPIGAITRNDLDLIVTAGGTEYKGNVFAGSLSIAGGQADRKNNVESVYLPPGTTGQISIAVTAANINSDGIPNFGGMLDQDFALVAYNIVQDGSMFIAPAGVNLLQENCQPFNGLADSNEVLTVSVSLRNAGSIDATSVSAMLLPTDQVQPITGTVEFGPLAPGGAAVDRTFQFRSGATCGEELRLSLRVWDTAADLGTLILPLPFTSSGPVPIESFDTATLPALPEGWTSAAAPPGATPWHTGNDMPDSPPNSASVAVSSPNSTSELVSPPILIQSATAELSFRQYYNLIGGAGGQLLISLDNDAPIDVLSLGGLFRDGPYSSFIADVAHGHWGWTGPSGDWLTTTIRLPSLLSGQTVRFHWTLTSGSAGSGAWSIDTITLADRGPCCDTPTVVQLEGPSIASTRNTPVQYTAMLTEAVFGLDSSADIQIEATGTATAGAVAITGSGAGPYSIELSEFSGQGTLRIRILEAACADTDGNLNLASEWSDPVLVDAVPVTCAVIRLDSDPTTASAIRFGITFSKPVTGLTLEDMTLTPTVTRSTLGALQGSGSAYEIEVHNIVGNGTVCLEVPADACLDALGNANLASESVCYTIEQVQPSTRFNYQLVATPTLTPSNEGDLPPTLSELTPGQVFYIELWARQENHESSGLTCVYSDVEFEPERLERVSQSPDTRFAEPLFVGAAMIAPGRISELGGCTLQSPDNGAAALRDEWVRIAFIQMRALAAPCNGENCSAVMTQVMLGSSTAESAAYGEGVVEPMAIVYGGLSLQLQPSARADLDRDGDVDSDDLDLFNQCRSRPAIAFRPSCARQDLDLDGDVDQSDFAMLQRCFSGTGVIVAPECAADGKPD